MQPGPIGNFIIKWIHTYIKYLVSCLKRVQPSLAVQAHVEYIVHVVRKTINANQSTFHIYAVSLRVGYSLLRTCTKSYCFTVQSPILYWYIYIYFVYHSMVEYLLSLTNSSWYRRCHSDASSLSRVADVHVLRTCTRNVVYIVDDLHSLINFVEHE